MGNSDASEPMVTTATTDPADDARMALERHAWQEAYDLLTTADTQGGLNADELELLAQASWWIGRLPGAIEARERAYGAQLKAGDPVGAAASAVLVGRDNLLRNQPAVANGWLQRAEKLLADQPENHVRGWLAVTRAIAAGLAGDFAAGVREAERAEGVAQRFADTDLGALALNLKGVSLINEGRVAEGLALVDESTVQAVAGGMAPQVAGAVYCSTIGACAGLGDWTRAAQWTEAQDRWCKREQIGGFPGMCRLHRAEVKRLHGAWPEAEAEARHATEELPGFLPAAVGSALYEIGVIRLRRGDLPAAEEALVRAHRAGRDPEPALSLLLLAQGKTAAANASIRRALDAPPRPTAWGVAPGTPLDRLRLLPAQVEIALAADDLARARSAANELSELARRYPSAASEADAWEAEGAVRLADGHAADMIGPLRQAVQAWDELEAPYEAARARGLLARALAADGGTDAAIRELRAAGATFERLGATLDLARTMQSLADLATDDDAVTVAPAAEHIDRTFMFTDIVDSTRFAELLGDDAWGDVIRWHDQTLRSLVAHHGGEEVKRTGDGFFLAFATAAAAIDCAIAIERRLAQQRKDQGFAPQVRIGVHGSQATRSGLDYQGQGVNRAARIAAEAAGGEVLISAETLLASGRNINEIGRRTTTLKGIRAPVEVVSIDWH
jgi:class 3 adenylate cyclase